MELEKLGPFRIGRVLGRGGMGAVYEGVHETDTTTVAIKVQPEPVEEDAESRIRFETEIETLKRLHHPNIVRLSGFGGEQGQLYYVMEFVDGPSLQQELRKKRLFQWYEVAKIGLEICQALRHAHDRGIIHRDIKPANILLDQQGNVKLSDFGIARFFGSQQITDSHSVIGTLEYMSPEQALAYPISSSTDIYSLGCVLYVLLTGKPPFPARSLPELLRKHQSVTPVPIHSVRYDVPEDLGYIISDMLHLRPEDRPRNAFLVTKRLQSLMRALKGDPDTIKVFPMSAETPKQFHEPVFPPAENGALSFPQTEGYDSGSVVDLARVTKPEVTSNHTPPPQRESLSGSFKRIGEDYAVSVFPSNVEPDDLESSRRVTSLLETATSPAVQVPATLWHGDGIPAKTQTARASNDDAPPSAPSNALPSSKKQASEGTYHIVQESETSLKPPKSPARFTAVADKQSDPFDEADPVVRPIISLPIVLTSTMLILIGLTVYYLIQPVPPDVLHARIINTLKKGESEDGRAPAQLKSAQRDIEKFLADYPNHPYANQIRSYQDELDLLEHERRLERRLQLSALRSLSPVERTYVSILTSSANDTEQMCDKLRAFIAVFQSVRLSEESALPERRASGPVEICVELARRRLQRLEQDAAEINWEQAQVVRLRLEEAAALESTAPARAEEIRRGIIELYQHNRWAKELVKEAKQHLGMETEGE